MAVANTVKGAIGGGASGAATGASLGGPWGALAGLGLGALAGGASSLFSKSPKTRQISTISPQQQGWQTRLGELGLQGLENPYAGFEPIAEQARNQFNTSTVPSIAERFTSMGSGGQRSSAFQGALGQAGAGLEGNLAALRSQYGLQNRQQSADMLNNALRPTFENYREQENPGFLETALSGLSGVGSQYGTLALGEHLGAFGNQTPGISPEVSNALRNPKFMQFLQNPKTQAFLKKAGIM
jgi:hypothetical protein